MEDQHTRDFFIGLCKDEEEKSIVEMLLSGASSEEIVERLLEKHRSAPND